MNIKLRNAGSFRDPAGAIHDLNGKIYRTVTQVGAENYEKVRATGFIERMIDQGRFVGLKEVTSSVVLKEFPDAVYVLEHPRLEFISYPYEWCFSQLKMAALHHLDLALDALSVGLTFSDGTAYNIQFIGPKPIFIDHLSVRPYLEGELWLAHNQFCEQFLNPLLLSSECGIPFNDWYRGRLEGIPTADIVKLLPARARLSLRMNAHVFLPAMFQKGDHKDAVGRVGNSRERSLSRRGYEGLLRQLRSWISSLEPRNSRKTVWGSYAEKNTYADAEKAAKKRAVEAFTLRNRPSLMLDLGCNSGDFSQLALQSGAQKVVGYDFDQGALAAAYQRATDEQLHFLPLFLDAANPSPAQGWAQEEREGFDARARGDAVVALAFIHHLAIGKNIALDRAVEWIVDRAPFGLIEFVPKKDPTVQAMLAHREDIFDQYTEEVFRGCLEKIATIVAETPVSKTGRIIFEYQRKAE